MLRNAIYDKMKPRSQLRREVELGSTCSIPGCNNLLTIFKGPGSDCYCREHQLLHKDYGGPGNPARPHTFHRTANYVCEECGWEVLEDPRLKDIEDESKKRTIARKLLHGDHQIRQADGGDDSEENVKCLCLICHAKKTVLNEDYKIGLIKIEERRSKNGLHNTTTEDI